MGVTFGVIVQRASGSRGTTSCLPDGNPQLVDQGAGPVVITIHFTGPPLSENAR